MNLGSLTIDIMTAVAALDPVGQPDIAYAPDHGKYQTRTSRRLTEGNLPKDLPAGFPEQLHGDLVWDGHSVGQTYDWTFVLSDDQFEEVDVALGHFKCKFKTS